MPSFESVLLTLAPATSGILSLVGSSWIIWMLVPKCRQRSSISSNNNNDNKLDQVKYRLLLGISVTDVFFSLVILPWALYMPANDTDVWGAMGNKQTCAAQGFLIQLGHMSSFYQAGLSHYYYTTICHGMSNQDFRRYYERIIHVSAVVWPLITATAALVMDLYNPMSIGCWMAPYPLGCNIDGSDIPCQRGRWAPVFAYVFTGIPVSLFMTYIGYTMLQIYFKVRSVSKRAQLRRFSSLQMSHALAIKSDDETQHRPSQRRHSITAGMASTVPVQQYSSQALGNTHPRPLRRASITGGMASTVTDALSIKSDQEIQHRPSQRRHSITAGMATTVPVQQYSSQALGNSRPRPLRRASITGGMASTVTTDNNSNNNNPQRNTDQARIRNTAIQAFYYVLAYSMTHTFVFLAANFDYFLPSGSPFLITLLGVFSFPLQGILNVFIFLRPRIHVLQTRDSSLSYWRAVHWATFHYDDGRNRATDSVVLPTANNIKSSKRSLGSSGNTTSVLLQNSSKTGESSKFFVANNTTTAGVNQIPITVSSNSDEVSDEDDSMVLSEPPEAVATAIDIQQEDVRATEGDPSPSKLCHIKGGSKEGWVGAAGDGVKHGEDINDMSFLSEGSEREA